MAIQELNRGLYRVEGVSKTYNSTAALSDVSLNIDSGEFVGLVGPSGSGKTTLLHMLAGVVQPDKGSVFIENKRLSGLKPGRELSQLVGVIHQQFDLVPHLSVINNVLAGRLGQWSLMKSIVSLISPREKDVAIEALERVGLGDRIFERTSRLSGGEQQRVAIARILVQNPRIIIADEPVSSLDPARAKDLLGLLTTIAWESSKTLIASVHSTELATENFSRIIGLRNGTIRFDLPVAQIGSGLLTELYELEGLESESIAS